MNRAVLNVENKSKHKAKAQLDKAYSIYMKIVSSFNSPSISKKNRFFLIWTIDNRIVWVKPKELNIGKNNLKPTYKSLDWVTSSNRMMSSNTEMLYYSYSGQLKIRTTIPKSLNSGDIYEIDSDNTIVKKASNIKHLKLKDILGID